MHVTRLLVLLFIPTKYNQNMSKGIKSYGMHKDESTISDSGDITT